MGLSTDNVGKMAVFSFSEEKKETLILRRITNIGKIVFLCYSKMRCNVAGADRITGRGKECGEVLGGADRTGAPEKRYC